VEIGVLIISVVVVAVIVISLFKAGPSHTVPPQEGRATELQRVEVRHVVDGDTVIVFDSWNESWIRLDAIDCPEEEQPWGSTAKAGLIKLIGGRHVHIETHGVDIHGRKLATIYLQHGRGSEWINVNERMVMLGHAWVMRKYYNHLPRSRQRQLIKLESWARSKRVGLWKTNNPIPPWLWRNKK
jgi:micrococcal nuclease